MPIDEAYIPKKGFEDLMNALTEDYKREIIAAADNMPRETRGSNEEVKQFVDGQVAELQSRMDAVFEQYRPRFRALAEEIIKIQQKPK